MNKQDKEFICKALDVFANYGIYYNRNEDDNYTLAPKFIRRNKRIERIKAML